jgi:leader peptidase (prepilin peptidase) / N-methyltransferase
MQASAALLALAPGLALGSFLNVVAARLPRGGSIVRPGSACLSCRTPIAWYDNLPLVSYLALRGRCRACGARIGVRYPAVELATALLVAGCVVAFGVTLEALVAACFCAALVAVSATDLEHRIIPDRIVLPAAAGILAARTLLEPSAEWAFAALGCSLFLFLAVLAYPAGMGMGDVKLALLLGAALGRAGPVALAVGMLAALLPAAFLLARYGSAGRKMAIPFGPFLALGGVVALFAGDALLDLYLRTWS